MKPLLKTTQEILIQLIQFIWKLFHNITPCKEKLFAWKFTADNECIACGVLEDYQHFFIECEAIQPFLTDIDSLLEKCGLQRIIKLKHIVIGYEIEQPEYSSITLFLQQYTYHIM
jgi:hypothetical protein